VPAEPALISPEDAARRVSEGAVLIDVRSQAGREADGSVPGALITDRNDLDARFGPGGITDPDTPVVVICGSVQGSRPVAEALVERGYSDVSHVEGGFPAWAAAGLPTAR